MTVSNKTDMMAAMWERINLMATAHNVSPAPKPRKPKPVIDGPWEESCPEYGDGDDTCIVMLDGVELIEITEGTLRTRKSLARRIAKLLNQGQGRMM